MISLETLRQAVLQRFDAVKKSNSVCTPVDTKRIDALIESVKSANPITATKLGMASWMLSYSNQGLCPIKPSRARIRSQRHASNLIRDS
jgi:hypothetical protein